MDERQEQSRWARFRLRKCEAERDALVGGPAFSFLWCLAEEQLRAGKYVWMTNPKGPVEGCFATSPDNFVDLWNEGYRPEVP